MNFHLFIFQNEYYGYWQGIIPEFLGLNFSCANSRQEIIDKLLNYFKSPDWPYNKTRYFLSKEEIAEATSGSGGINKEIIPVQVNMKCSVNI